MNKRLLACLLVFVFVGGLCISSAFIFRIQEIKISFSANAQADLIKIRDGSEDKALTNYRNNVKWLRGKSTIFELDRVRVVNDLSRDPLIRVSQNDIVAKFPNKVEITVKERYPMYHIDSSRGVLVMDYSMQIISNKRSIITDYNTVNVTDQFEFENPYIMFNDSHLGTNLRDYTVSQTKTRIECLEYMARLFFNQKNVPNDELQLGQLIESIAFETLNNSFVMMLNDPRTPDRKNHIKVVIHNYEEIFNQKIADVWNYLEREAKWNSGTFILKGYIGTKLDASWHNGQVL